MSEFRAFVCQAAQRSLEAARGITEVVMSSLSSMESDAANFREHANASSEKHDQGLLELAEAYEVGVLSHSHVGRMVWNGEQLAGNVRWDAFTQRAWNHTILDDSGGTMNGVRHRVSWGLSWGRRPRQIAHMVLFGLYPHTAGVVRVR